MIRQCSSASCSRPFSTSFCRSGKKLEIPSHHNLESYLSAYVAEAEIHGDREGPLFRSLERDGPLLDRRFNRQSAWEMLARPARTAGITTPICNHSFRATGITAYLENPEARVEVAQYLRSIPVKGAESYV